MGLVLAGMILSVGIIRKNSPAAESPAPVSPPPSETRSPAKVLKTEGEVSLTRDSRQTKINVDDLLYEKDVIQTSANSSAIIVFLANDSTVRLDGNSKIEISLYQGSGQDTKINLDQPFGKTWHRIKQLLGQNSSYEVNTPTVVASVRGTGFGVDADDKDATITVDDGKVNTKLVDRSGPEIKVLHEINVVKDEEAKIDSKEFQRAKDQVERGETPDLKPKRIDKDKVEEWIKVSREEEREVREEKEEKMRKREGKEGEMRERDAKEESREEKIEGVKEEKVRKREGGEGEMRKREEKEEEMRKREGKEAEIKEEIKEEIKKPADEIIEAVKGEKTESGEERIEKEKEEEMRKREEKDKEKQPEAIIERIKDFIEGKPPEDTSRPHLDVAR